MHNPIAITLKPHKSLELKKTIQAFNSCTTAYKGLDVSPPPCIKNWVFNFGYHPNTICEILQLVEQHLNDTNFARGRARSRH